jgi:hypothetical protein
VALGNVVAPDELGSAEECSFVAEDTKAKFETEYGSVEHVFVVMSAKVGPLLKFQCFVLPLCARPRAWLFCFPFICPRRRAGRLQ